MVKKIIQVITDFYFKLPKIARELFTLWIPKSLKRKATSFLFGIIIEKDVKTSLKTQNQLIGKINKNISNMIVFVVPEFNSMNGGIYSIFSIARESRAILKEICDDEHEVIIVTRPNKMGFTYARQTNFKNCEYVFRFDQLELFNNISNMIIHIPEYSSSDFYSQLSVKQKEHFKRIKNIQINIMNQNINLMPERKDFIDLFNITDNISLTVGHHKYCSQMVTNKYGLPTLLIPAYTDLSNYPKKNYEEKEDMIIYSPDENIHKEEIIKLIMKNLPKFKLVEIRNYTFNEYMELVTRAKFGLTFGEGYDGYLAQPIYQGGISFAVYNDKFFPDEKYKDFPNVFHSYHEMKNNIVSRIIEFNNNPEYYKRTNRIFLSEFEKLYNYNSYVESIKKFYLQQYDYYPNEK